MHYIATFNAIHVYISYIKYTLITVFMHVESVVDTWPDHTDYVAANYMM